MKALVYEGSGKIALKDVPRPHIEQDTDVIVRVALTAICASDLHVIHWGYNRPPNKILGHEFVGVIDEVGSGVKRFKAGERVLGICTIQCGQCPECNRGFPVYCHNGMRYSKEIDGAQAEYVRIPFADASVEPIPDGISYEDALLVGDIFPTGFMGAQYGSIVPGDVVAVFGAGPVGLAAMEAARLFGPSQIIAVDILDYRLDKAREMGADTVINAQKDDVAQAIGAATGGKGADVSIEAVGSAPTLQGAIASTAKGGNVSIIGIFRDPVEIPMHTMVHQGLSIRMSVVNVSGIDRLMALVGKGKVDLKPIITHTMPLDDIERAYQMFDEKLDGCVKIALRV